MIVFTNVMHPMFCWSIVLPLLECYWLFIEFLVNNMYTSSYSERQHYLHNTFSYVREITAINIKRIYHMHLFYLYILIVLYDLHTTEREMRQNKKKKRKRSCILSVNSLNKKQTVLTHTRYQLRSVRDESYSRSNVLLRRPPEGTRGAPYCATSCSEAGEMSTRGFIMFPLAHTGRPAPMPRSFASHRLRPSVARLPTPHCIPFSFHPRLTALWVHCVVKNIAYPLVSSSSSSRWAFNLVSHEIVAASHLSVSLQSLHARLFEVMDDTSSGHVYSCGEVAIFPASSYMRKEKQNPLHSHVLIRCMTWPLPISSNLPRHYKASTVTVNVLCIKHPYTS